MKTALDVNTYPVDFLSEKRYYVRRAHGMEPGGANENLVVSAGTNKENANDQDQY